MPVYAYWFLAALILFGLEMVSGTFFLLVLGIAMAIGGSAALLGLALPWQLSLAALAGIGGTLLLRRRRAAAPAEPSQQSLDIGQTVKVIEWHTAGGARVHYRGAEWDAEAETPDMPRDVPLYIKELRGSTLILTHRKP